VGPGRPTISTHILDTASGQPARGVRVRLWRLAEGGEAGDPPMAPTLAGDGTTDEDGRVRDLLAGSSLTAGTWRLEFLPEGRFFARVALDVVVEDAGRSYHVPLLLAPYGISSYRGS
jgi:5-hydroxyisourate hydrolase